MHRPADSRLLSNLLSHEKDYVRSLYSQLDYGQASLASFSAYAAASPPPASRTIGSVATALAGTQDALRGYVLAVEEWCEQLKMLKDMEDEVGTIARDREILVDRLIKASKANNPKRRSLLPSSTGSNQGSPVLSSNHALDQLVFSNSKLNLAQSELQACETHLTEKERMLAQMRETCLTGGLKMRCRALAECGLKWSELGRTGLQALDTSNSRGSFDRPTLLQKPLPDINYPYQRPSSDISSSLAPSQSASQIFHPDATSDQYHSNGSGSSGPRGRVHGPSPEADIRDESRVELTLPPAHAISEGDHYTPPQARITERTQENGDDDLGGSSAEEETDERQYEVHENPLFAHHPLASKPKPKQLGGSKTRLPLKRSPKRLDSDNTATMPASASAPLPAAHNISDRFGNGRAYSLDEHRDSSQYPPQQRTRKRSTFLGLGALSSIFHRRDRTSSAPASGAAAGPDAEPYTSSSPNKKEKWRTRTDKNLKKASGGRGGKADESSDDEAGGQPSRRQAGSESGQASAPSYLLPAIELKAQSETRGKPTGKESASESHLKRTSSGGRKLRKSSDGAQRKTSGGDDAQTSQQLSDAKKAGTDGAKDNEGSSRAQNMGNGYTVSPLSSASVSRSSTVRSQSTVKTSPSTRPASLDLPSSSGKPKRASTLTKAAPGGGGGGSAAGAHRRRTSLGHVSSPPTSRNGQMSLLSIVEDVTKQNRQSWLQANPNNLLVEVKAPQSVFQTLNLDGPSTSSEPQQTQSDVAAGRRESPLRHQLYAANDLRRNSLPASSSEPSLPLKNLPPTPTQKMPLRSALRNRSASPSPSATLTPPRTGSPGPQVAMNGVSATTEREKEHLRPPAGRADSAGSSVKDDDDDATSIASAYETGHEDFDSGPPTPTGLDQSHPNGASQGQQQQQLPNGHAGPEMHPNGSHVSGGSAEGTATPPSRRKSVRVSLKPTFSPTPPAITDYEEDRPPWAPNPPAKDSSRKNVRGNGGGWSSGKAGESIWDESSDDEDEEYSRAREMLSRASHKLEKAYKGG